ncbi:DUF2946 family protein [Paucibacter sp. APW11]|uniref:DUF2946 family protein n=1 Tax=Roseateles aquae TaxID=3077235 RepID=A0ABU3PG86_9BURK|nr:DUF2946 family protein [Paucibacter sp. APW11]MDT9001400.1 DUF2946 family protein [Paucibacter sp. APW11]
MRARPCALQRWLVLAALLLATLAPAVSQALAWSRGDALAWSQVCRASVVSPRAQASILAARAAKDKESVHGLFEHCPSCAAQAQDLAPPPATGLALPARLEPSQAMPERFFSAAVTNPVWLPGQSRAPPSLI